jgi:phage terminase large subunit-like protein
MPRIQAIIEAQKLADEQRCIQLWNRRHKKQDEFYSAPQKIRSFFAGNRVGKTVAGAQEVCRYAFNYHEFRRIDLPVEIWVACPSYDTQFETTQKKLQAMIPKHRIVDISYIKKGIWGRIKLDNGVMITFKSYEQGREKFQGAGKRLIWFDEEPPRDIWEESIVRHEAGQPLDIILTMTPVNGVTWVYDELYLATDNKDIKIVTAGWEDNPWLTEEQIDQMSRGLTQDALQVRRYGKFIRRVGLVCNWWDREKHIVDEINIQSSWNIYRIIDFGWSSSKTCVLWIAVDSYDRTYIFDGIYENHMNDEALAKVIKERESARGINVIKSWADNQPERIDTLKRNGVMCEPVEKIATGDSWDVTRSEAMHALSQVDKVTGATRLSVSSKLMYYNVNEGRDENWFIREVETLRWKEKRTDGIIKEQPKWDKDSGFKDSHYDALDTFSYFCVMFAKRGARHKEIKERRESPKRRVVNRITGY